MPAEQMIREIRDAGLAAWIGPDDFVSPPPPRASRHASGSSVCITSGSGPRRAAGEPLIRFQEPRSRLTTNLGSVLGTTARNVQLRARRGRRIGDSFALTLPAGSHTPMMDLRLRPAGPMLEPLTRGMSHASLGALTRVHLPALCRCRMN